MAPNTTKRFARAALRREHSKMVVTLMTKYDASKNGALSRDEVKVLAADLLSEYPPLTEDDIEMAQTPSLIFLWKLDNDGVL